MIFSKSKLKFALSFFFIASVSHAASTVIKIDLSSEGLAEIVEKTKQDYENKYADFKRTNFLPSANLLFLGNCSDLEVIAEGETSVPEAIKNAAQSVAKRISPIKVASLMELVIQPGNKIYGAPSVGIPKDTDFYSIMITLPAATRMLAPLREALKEGIFASVKTPKFDERPFRAQIMVGYVVGDEAPGNLLVNPEQEVKFEVSNFMLDIPEHDKVTFELEG